MKKTEKLESQIIVLKQLNEQLETELSKKELFIEECFPLVNNISISPYASGTVYGNHGTVSYKVLIEVDAGDLHKLIRYLTHRKLNTAKFASVRHDIEKDIKREMQNKND